MYNVQPGTMGICCTVWICTDILFRNTVIGVWRGSMAAEEVVGLALLCSGNKYQSAVILAFWQSPVYTYPSTVKEGLPHKPPWILSHLHPSSSFSGQQLVQTKEKKKNCQRCGKKYVHNMGNGPESSSHDMLHLSAKGRKWTLVST